jgi:transcriptional regulator
MYNQITDKAIVEAQKMRDKGMTVADIARALNKSVGTIQKRTKPSPKLIEQVIKMRHAGTTYRQIGRVLGLTEFAVEGLYRTHIKKNPQPFTIKQVALAPLPADDMTEALGVEFLLTRRNQCTWPYGIFQGRHRCCGELKTSHRSYCDKHAKASRM